MTTIAVIICDQERYRLIDTGSLQRFTDTGWQRFTSVHRDGVRADQRKEPLQANDDAFYPPDIANLVLDAADILHFLYGWDISEVNVITTREDIVDADDGEELVRELANRGSLQTASINYIGDEM